MCMSFLGLPSQNTTNEVAEFCSARCPGNPNTCTRKAGEILTYNTDSQNNTCEST